MRRFIPFFLITLMVIVICFVYWPNAVDHQYECIEYVIGEEEYKKIPVTLLGTTYYSVLRENYIDYTITIGDLRMPVVSEDEYILPLSYTGNIYNDNGEVMVDWRNTIPSQLRIYEKYVRADIDYFVFNENVLTDSRVNYGGMFFSKDFSDLIILKSIADGTGSSWSTEDGNGVIVSAGSISEAELLALDFGMILCSR